MEETETYVYTRTEPGTGPSPMVRIIQDPATLDGMIQRVMVGLDKDGQTVLKVSMSFLIDEDLIPQVRRLLSIMRGPVRVAIQPNQTALTLE